MDSQIAQIVTRKYQVDKDLTKMKQTQKYTNKQGIKGEVSVD